MEQDEKVPHWFTDRAKRVAAIRTGSNWAKPSAEYTAFLSGYQEAIRDLERLRPQLICIGSAWVVSLHIPVNPPTAKQNMPATAKAPPDEPA